MKKTPSEAGRLGGIASVPATRARAQALREAYARSPKLCAMCNEPIRFEGKLNTYCSHRCGALMGNAIRYARTPRRHGRSKTCLYCQKPLHWRKKNYCSHECHAQKKFTDLVEGWKSGKLDAVLLSSGRVAGFVRRYLIESRGEACEQCGWAQRNPVTGKVPITVDHVDGRWQNGSESNLRLLCPNCHSLTPTFQALNKGNGHPARRNSYRPAAERQNDRNGSDPAS